MAVYKMTLLFLSSALEVSVQHGEVILGAHTRPGVSVLCNGHAAARDETL